MKIELDVEYISDLQSLLNFADCSRILKSFDLIQDSENRRRESRSDRSGRCIGRMAATGESLVEQYETRRPVRRGTRGDWTFSEMSKKTPKSEKKMRLSGSCFDY